MRKRGGEGKGEGSGSGEGGGRGRKEERERERRTYLSLLSTMRPMMSLVARPGVDLTSLYKPRLLGIYKIRDKQGEGGEKRSKRE